MTTLIENYDREKGAQHNFMDICHFFSEWQWGPTDWFEKWVQMLTFDALIGNTDRHQENWEITSHFIPSQLKGRDNMMLHHILSPAFDNGTAMGYEVTPEGLAKRLNNLDSYIARGTHHMKWRIEDEKQQGHFKLLANLINHDARAKDIIAELLHCVLTALYDRIMELTRYDIRNENYRLTPERAEFMIALIKARLQKAKETINA